MKFVLFVIFALALITACGKQVNVGDPGGPCKSDGTCNSSSLVCYHGDNFYCDIARPQFPSFCDDCFNKCGAARFLHCEVGDPTTWGGKSSVCECRP